MRAWAVIYRKEIADTLRDRRTLATMLFVPMVAYPLTLLLTTETIAVQQKESEAREVAVIASSELPRDAIAALEAGGSIRVDTSSIATSTRTLDPGARAALASGSTDVVVALDARGREAIDRDSTGRITLFFDATKSYADASVRRVEKALDQWTVEARAERMARHRLPAGAAVPVEIDRRSIATRRQIGTQIAALALPPLILIFIALSSFYPAVDLTAGEKERRTLATLLCAPVRPFEIVLGKYAAVVTVGTLAGLLNVVVLSMTLLRVAAGDHAGARMAAAFSIPVLKIVSTLPLVPLISLPIGALMLLVAALARSFRDASYLLTPVLLLAIAPASLAALPGIEISPLLAAVPLANAALLMKAVLLARASTELVLVVIVASLAFTLALLYLVERVFQDERVLFSQSGRRAELSLLLFQPPPAAVSTGLVFAGLIFVANYYGSYFAESWGPFEGIVFTQAIAHVLPAVLLALWLRRTVGVRSLLLLSRPSGRAMASGLLVGAGAWIGVSLPAGWLTAFLVPGQSEAARALAEALHLEEAGLVTSIVAFAIVPAIAEELAFRGVLLGLFERTLKGWLPLVLQALLFAAMHGSVFRLLPTALLGLVLGVLAQRTRSIFPPMLAHAMTNGILVSVEKLGSEPVAHAIERPTAWAFLGLTLVGTGLLLLRRPAAPLTRAISDT